MVCADCQNLLSDYLDGDISDRHRREVDEHITNCEPCAVLRDDLARIIEASANLPLHAPSMRVWQNVEREISGGSNVVAGPQAWWNRLSARRYDFSISGRQLVAAAAGVVILASVVFTISMASPGTIPVGDGSWQQIGTNQQTTVIPLAATERREEVNQLQATVNDMAQRLSDRKSQWSPELRATFDKAMAEIDAQIAERQKAYDANGTETTRVPLLTALRSKLHALEEFATVNAKPAK